MDKWWVKNKLQLRYCADNCIDNKHSLSGSFLCGPRLNFSRRILSSRIFFVQSHFDQWTTVWGMPGEQRAHSLCCLQVSPYCENRPHVRSSLWLFRNNRKTTVEGSFQPLHSRYCKCILTPSCCAISNGFFLKKYYNYLTLTTDLLLMWGARHYIIPCHLACQLDPEGPAVLCRPAKKNKGYLEKLKQPTYNNKDDIKFRCTHWFTNRSDRPDLSLFTALTLWGGEGTEAREKRQEPWVWVCGGAEHILILYVLFFQLNPLVPGGLVVHHRPGQKVTLWLSQFQKEKNEYKIIRQF